MCFGVNFSIGNFEIHIREAIVLNKERKSYYGEQSQGVSNSISSLLIAGEYLLLPLAIWADRRAVIWNDQGIPIIQQDFVSMSLVQPAENRCEPAAAISPMNHKGINTMLRPYVRQINKAADNFDWSSAAHQTMECMEKVETICAKEGFYAPMLIHVLESAGYFAVNNINYQKQSRGATDRFSRFLLKGHCQILRSSFNRIDHRANKVHQMGVGIIINDVPAIPFREAMELLI